MEVRDFLKKRKEERKKPKKDPKEHVSGRIDWKLFSKALRKYKSKQVMIKEAFIALAEKNGWKE